MLKIDKSTVSIILLSVFAIMLGCATAEKKSVTTAVDKNEKTAEVKKEALPEKKTEYAETKTGWIDNDTYIVQVSSSDLQSAVDAAKTKILKDIIFVRAKLYGSYQKITEVKQEFQDPLKNGEIVKKRQIENGIEIYYQIRDRELRKKFEKK